MIYKGKLTPTTIVDKNGRQTIVHRRSEPSGVSASLPKPALSDIAKASAALMLLSMRTGDEDTRRNSLIREMVNSGMDDDDAVEFLSLTVMPVELLEEVSEFIHRPNGQWGADRHRQSFFRFANDAYYEFPDEQASIIVRNGMKVTANGEMFTESTLDRMKELSRVGIDYLKTFEGDDLDRARKISFFVSTSILFSDDVAERYFGKSDRGEEFDGVDGYTYIKDDRITEIIVNSGDRFDALVEQALKRNSCDPEILRELMENPAPSISVGVL